jgi:uncharacterized HhH-GPD family protein
MTIVWTGRPEVDQLLETDPLALLIGLVLDQQVKMEKAFSGPYELKQRLGHLDARRIALMEPEALDAVFRERPALHRFPGSSPASTAATPARSGATWPTVTSWRGASPAFPASET